MRGTLNNGHNRKGPCSSLMPGRRPFNDGDLSRGGRGRT